MSLKQQRSGFTRNINIDPIIISVSRITSLVSDGVGGLVEDPYATPTVVSLTVRVVHEQKNPEPVSEGSAGLSSNLGRMVLSNYKNEIAQYDVIPYEGRNYKIGIVDPLRKFGGVYGYQAPLVEVNN